MDTTADTDTAASASGRAAPASRRRDTALDGLRTLAVLLMISSHTSRLIVWESRRGWSRFALLIEPLTASLFLILVGASLVHSWRASEARGRAAWFRKQGLRASALWVVSCVFYSIEEGFHWPDAVLLSGILATIAYAILAGMLMVSLRRAVPVLIAVSCGLAGLHWYLDVRQQQWFFINAGNSPMLPLFLFTCLGALGTLALESRNRLIRPALVTCAVLALGLIFSRHPFVETFSKPLGRFETVRIVVSGTSEARIEKSIPYYNLRPILVPVIASMTVLVYAALAALASAASSASLRPAWDKAARFLFPMGRHSLDVYILHLSLLAVLIYETRLMRPLTKTWQGDAVLAGVIAVSHLWAMGRDFFRFGKRRDPLR
jgi:uncharacterized membrane protein